MHEPLDLHFLSLTMRALTLFIFLGAITCPTSGAEKDAEDILEAIQHAIQERSGVVVSHGVSGQFNVRV